MISDLRKKLGPWMVALIIGFIAFVFVFAGVFSPSSTSISGGAAGSVNGEPILLSDFNRAYNRKVEMMRNYGFKEEHLKAMHIGDSVFQELVTRRLMIEQAEKLGLMPSDEEVRLTIAEIPAFHKDGKFHYDTYIAV